MSKDQKLRRAYWGHVSSIVEDAMESEEPAEAITELVEQSEWIIYTWRNLEVLRFTENEEAVFDAFGSDALGGFETFGPTIAMISFYAMQQDCFDKLREA